MGIDAFVAFPTVGKVRPDMFHVIGLVEGAKVNLVSSWHNTASDVKNRCISTAEISDRVSLTHLELRKHEAADQRISSWKHHRSDSSKTYMQARPPPENVILYATSQSA